MKNWKIDYSVCYMDGTVEEREGTIKADNIAMATTSAGIDIEKALRKDPKVMDFVIWGVTIIDDNPF